MQRKAKTTRPRTKAPAPGKYDDEFVPETPTIPRFMCDHDGRIREVLTKSHGWCPVEAANTFFLRNVMAALEQAGKKHSRLWYALDQEIKRRPPSGGGSASYPRSTEEVTA